MSRPALRRPRPLITLLASVLCVACADFDSEELADGHPACTGGKCDDPNGQSGGYLELDARPKFTCGLRASGNIVCWGDRSSEGAPPAGTLFRDFSSSRNDTCAIEAGDGALHCWGDGVLSNDTPPNGSFTDVHVDDGTACALRDDGAILCWGYTEGVNQLSGTHKSMAMDATQVCGARESDGSIHCRSFVAIPSLSPPDSSFKTFDTAYDVACGVRSDDTLECWGTAIWGHRNAPAGAFKAVSVSRRFACGVQQDGEITCWGSGAPTEPAGQFVSVSTGPMHMCAIASDGQAICSPDSGRPETVPPAFGMEQVAVGWQRGSYGGLKAAWVCGMRAADGTLRCWGSDAPSAPSGSFLDLAGAEEHFCGISADHEVLCWGKNVNGVASAPAGNDFVAIDTGNYHTCATRLDGTVTCWGTTNGVPLSPPAGAFEQVAIGHARACGLRPGGAVECWGEALDEPVPAGTFRHIDMAGGFACGVRTDSTIDCWGTGPFDASNRVNSRYHHPQGSGFARVYVGHNTACAVGQDGTPVCWGQGVTFSDDSMAAPDRPMSQIAVDETVPWPFACGIAEDEGALLCWGRYRHGL